MNQAAKQIANQGGNCVLSLKGNHGDLQREMEQFLEDAKATVSKPTG